MTSSELESRNIAYSMRKSVENLVISSQDAIGQSISQALTFSGVITQHANQMIQENRSISRSPSPSLRTDAGTDIENDKISEHCLSTSSLGGGDSASISSSEALTVVSATPAPKVTGSNPRGGELGVRTKKKSWYNSLYPTYKSKSDDFKRLFKDLPDDERLIVDYSCALQKDILAHGRLYASQNYLCFYASIFGWETSMSLKWKDVTAITKEKTALVIPNAILVCTEGEKNFLTSFTGRDKAYLMLFRIWQNALMDQPRSSQEIWQWVHSCYGEELGFNSDDEGYSRDFPDEAPAVALDAPTEDLVDSSMEASGAGDDSRTTRSASQGRDASPPLVRNGEAEEGEVLPTDMSDTSDSEPDKPHNGGVVEKCSMPHDGKLFLQQQFPFNIDQMFTMIFTNSKFNLELLAARGTSDYVQAPWQPQSGLDCRQLSYTMTLPSGPIGPKEVQVTETQVINKCSKPGVLYSIDSSSDNSGIPYADYFSVHAHYCLQRISEHCTQVSFYGQVKYKKSMWPMIKAFLEKNTVSGLEDFARLLETRLLAEAESGAPTTRKARRHRRLVVPESPEAVVKAPVVIPTARVARPRVNSGVPLALGPILLVLLVLNALLYWRLYYVDTQPALDIDELQNRLGAMGSAQWARVLEAHAHSQRAHMRAWRHALHTAVQHLSQTEQALTKLLETIKPSLEQAVADGDAGRDTRGTRGADGTHGTYGTDEVHGTREVHNEL